MVQSPKVSIGLPVYNGEHYLATAIESILAQTYENLEMIISDNASSDRTEAICREFSGRDRRIRYTRQAKNLGAAANYNQVFAAAEGSKYFKWAAADDWIAPTFVEKCVAKLEKNPDAVLCQSRVKIVDDCGRLLETYDHAAFGTGSSRTSERFRARLRAHRCMDVFGVIRSEVLASSALIEPRLGADRTLLLELALRGRFLSVPEYLFFNRDHAERFTRKGYTPQEELAWYSPGGGWRVCRTWTLYSKGLQLIHGGVEGVERQRCYGHLLRSLGDRRRLTNLILEPLVGISPRLFHLVSKVKRLVRGHRSRPVPNAPAHAVQPTEEARR